MSDDEERADAAEAESHRGCALKRTWMVKEHVRQGRVIRSPRQPSSRGSRMPNSRPYAASASI